MIKGINLIPESVQKERRLKRWRRLMISSSFLYLVALVFVYAGQAKELRLKTEEAGALVSERNMIAAKSASFAELTKKLGEIREKESDLKKRLAVAEGLAGKRVAWSGVLKRLSHDIPKNVWLRSLSTTDAQGADGKRIKFLGSSTDNRGISDFIFVLENSGHFQDVSLSYSQKRDFGADILYDFEIFLTLKKTDEIMYEW